METKLFLDTNLKFLRNLYNKTQYEVGKVIGKGASAIGNYENGIREPSAVDIGLLANYYNVTVEDLLTKDLRYSPIENIKEKDFINIAKQWASSNDMTPEEKQKFLRELASIIDKENE